MPDSRPLAASVFSALRWSATARVLTQVITWGSTIIVARLLTPDDYGLVALAGVIVAFFMSLSDFGLGAAVIRDQSASDNEVASLDSSLVISGTCMAIGIAVLAPIIASVLGDPRIETLVRVLALQPAMASALAIPNALLTKALRFDLIAKISVASGMTAAIVTLSSAYMGFGVWSLVMGWTTETAFRSLLTRHCSRSWRLSWPRIGILREYCSFSKWVIGEKSLWYWYAQADNLIVGRILGTQALGYFSMAKQIAMTPADKVMPVLNQISLPAFSRIQNQPGQVAQQSLKLLRLGAAYALPTFWGLAAVAPNLVRVLLGEQWRGAGAIMSILCLAMPFRMISALLSPAVTALGRPDVPFKNMLLATLVVPSAMLVGSIFGSTGVAVAWAVSIPVVTIYFFTRTGPILGLRISSMARVVRGPVLASLLMAVAVFAANPLLASHLGLLAGLASAIVTGVVLYGVILAVLDRALLHECRQFLRSVAKTPNQQS